MIMCPPLSDYSEPPKDHSHSELYDCPGCKQKMWLSDKKKGILAITSALNNEIILRCYLCITKIAEENPGFFKDSIDIEL